MGCHWLQCPALLFISEQEYVCGGLLKGLCHGISCAANTALCQARCRHEHSHRAPTKVEAPAVSLFFSTLQDHFSILRRALYCINWHNMDIAPRFSALIEVYILVWRLGPWPRWLRLDCTPPIWLSSRLEHLSRVICMSPEPAGVAIYPNYLVPLSLKFIIGTSVSASLALA